MKLGPYELLAQLGAGADGVAYRARDTRSETPVEIRVLTGARANPARWKQLSKRLRLASLLTAPSTWRATELNLAHDPPFLALPDPADTDIIRSTVLSVPLAPTVAIGQAHRVAAAL